MPLRGPGFHLLSAVGDSDQWRRPLQVTNHVTWGGGGEVQPGLGMSWSHVPRSRILLERVESGSSSLRSATLIKSSRQVRRKLLLTFSAATGLAV